MDNEHLRLSLRKKIRLFVVITIVGLLANGLSAFFLEPELRLVLGFSFLPAATHDWLTQVHNAILETLTRYPFMLYGYDWLGFAHLLIAIAFIGPLIDPIKNEWVIKFGMIAALLSILIALISERFKRRTIFLVACRCICWSSRFCNSLYCQ